MSNPSKKDNPWKKGRTSPDHNFIEILSEEIAKRLQIKEDLAFAETICNNNLQNSDNISPDILRQVKISSVGNFCHTAKALQCQFDKEHEDKIQTEDLNATVFYDNSLDYDDLESEDCWDQIERNEKQLVRLPKRRYMMKDGRRNARGYKASPEICADEGAEFDMKLPNTVFNKLRAHFRSNQSKKHKKQKVNWNDVQTTAELGIDKSSKRFLYKLINTADMLEEINGVISTGKKSIMLQANKNSSSPYTVLPKCAIKVFKTTVNEFKPKPRNRYKARYCFKECISKQNPRKIVHLWVDKEKYKTVTFQQRKNNCPNMICVKKHIYVLMYLLN